MEQEENKNIEENKDILCKTLEETENAIKSIVDSGLQKDNIEVLGQLIDIHKDIENEKYWKEKINMYRDNYNDYNEGSYGRRGVRGTGPYSRYRDGGSSYGRRGVPGTGRGRYRGEEMMEEMYNAYNDYMDSSEYGNYGTGDSMQKIEIMADSLIDFIHHIKKEAKTPEEKRLIDEKLQEIGRM